ncbi:REJ domain-containing protein [Methylomagnum ishizawai]|uniref:REJ domain-containing protein n=1 Tax=Methylomagnum ishizawai TaxID=1760988 RepID=A0A1Y6CUQ9_9GAMM|nr:PKD domain-containing protein [Methylomagnum ishizawai]SMF94047.1 REJ domain-containing protein [Methylomagnum ishizawai]
MLPQRHRFHSLPALIGLCASLGWWPTPGWAQTARKPALGTPLGAQIGLSVGVPTYNADTDTYDAPITLHNRSAKKTFHGAFNLVVGPIEPAGISLANASGTTTGGKSYLSIALPDHGLAPHQRIKDNVLSFANADDAHFKFQRKLYGYPGSKRPTAVPGPDQSPALGDTVTLDGSGSTDPRGLALRYAWSIAAAPTGSTASLSDPASAQPSLTPDQPGSYQIRLLVTDGNAASDPTTLTLTVASPPPVADAGGDQTAGIGDTVYLDGTNSYDPEDADLGYRWTFTQKPQGSQASLADADTDSPSFVADQAGTYQVQLIVNNGAMDSAPALANIVVSAQADTSPVADAGFDQTATTGDTVYLDGSASYDPEGADLDYRWTFTQKPQGSQASLADADTDSPSFVADQAGTYQVQLIVNDGTYDSAPATSRITVVAP